jgi:hypothetical protein
VLVRGGGAMKRARKPKLPPSVTPHQAVVLCVDTAERSGWALYIDGTLRGFGEVDMLRPEFSRDLWGVSGWNAARVCMHALWECSRQLADVVLVFERPFRGTTQGQWIGAWKAAFVAQGGRKAAMVGCYPATWRARALGSPNQKRDEARETEQQLATQVIRRDMPKLAGIRAEDVRAASDAAAAIAIGQWAIRAGEVGAKLPKRRKLKPVSVPSDGPANDVGGERKRA